MVKDEVVLWLMPAQKAAILRLLEASPGLRGLELVERSEGVLSRGVVYVILNSMENLGLIYSMKILDRLHYYLKDDVELLDFENGQTGS